MIMKAIQLMNIQNAEVIYQPIKEEIVLKLKGIISASQLSFIRGLVIQLFGNLKARTFVMDLENSEYQEFDFGDTEKKEFYKSAEKGGIKSFLLKYPNKYFYDQLQRQWEVFFKRNDIKIKVVPA